VQITAVKNYEQKNTATSGQLIKAALCCGPLCSYFCVQVSRKYEVAYGKTATFVASNSSGLRTKEMFL
jgi:hypothetical protein